MTNSPTNNSAPSIRTSFVAIFVVLLLLGIAVINLPPLTVTPSKPYIITTQGLNVRSGPSTLFSPPIGSLAANQKTDVIARSLDGQWFKITYYNGFGWVFAAYTTPSVDPSRLPVDAGPPVPVPSLTPIIASPTPAPTSTAIIQTTANLVLGNVQLSEPLPLSCDRTVHISIEVANLGNQPTASSGKVSVRDIYLKNYQEDASSTGAFGVIQNGQTINVMGIFLTVSTFADEDHKLVITINPDGNVAETTDSDNSREFTYTLQGDC